MEDVMRIWKPIAVAILAIASLAAADPIGKWRQPDGSLYLGNHPPAGSVLLETLEIGAPVAETDESVIASADLQSAAADGREIMRRRAIEREAVRARDLEKERWAEEHEANEDRDIVIFHLGRPFHHRRFPHRGPSHRDLRTVDVRAPSSGAPVVSPVAPPHPRFARRLQVSSFSNIR
jgi:hypothetical protein